MPDTRIAFKAGRAFRREGTNFVDPSPTKGAVELVNGDDDLLHFQWRNRVTNETEEDLILFPSDASFNKVAQSAWGRTYVLKFSSSDQRHFFWMQNADASRDAEFVMNVNKLLADPSDDPVWLPAVGSSEPTASGSNTQRELTQTERDGIQNFVNSLMLPGGAAGSNEHDVALSDILTPANLTPLFTSRPDLITALFPHLPPDLPSPPSAETLQQIIASPQFRAAVRNLDQAFRTGLLGGLVRGLGLPEEAGTSVEAFLRAIQEQAGKEGEGGESMDTD
ncbi:hypothetical protein EIP91_004616 [Steccherinum ochraceum]|uniref:Uncharacterized protein n=1 Tax=Steccherinum ochraceum TaxID=92696 RepID=A0A4R0RQU9_9APHY|nr:hypothetical protein EIP91_004616 [Steccherinum ochraceum]